MRNLKTCINYYIEAYGTLRATVVAIGLTLLVLAVIINPNVYTVIILIQAVYIMLLQGAALALVEVAGRYRDLVHALKEDGS